MPQKDVNGDHYQPTMHRYQQNHEQNLQTLEKGSEERMNASEYSNQSGLYNVASPYHHHHNNESYNATGRTPGKNPKITIYYKALLP